MIETLKQDPRVLRALALARGSDERTLADQEALTSIPAPPFGEDARGRAMARMLVEAGVDSVHVDEAGNVLALLDGRRDAPPVVLAAHLDTVFPPETDVTVRRTGNVLRAPGISDDGRGLAVILAVARCCAEAGVVPRTPVLLAATVGEEGLGDLRGVKYLFGPAGAAHDAAGFISVDGAGLTRIVVRGVGSRRFRIHARGPGGHSWVDWGAPNPIHTLGSVVAGLVALPLPANPRTTLTVARWSGGTAINAIPRSADVEVDTRSESESHLRDLEARVRAVVRTLAEEERARGDGGVTLEVEPIGARPCGTTPEHAPLVRTAVEATRSVGAEPTLAVSSTDANIPMSRGIPAVAIGGGGEAGKAHTPEEWYRNVRGPEGVMRALLTVLATAGT